jgi:hypothetical protein
MSYAGTERLIPARRRRPPSTPCDRCGATPTMDEEFVVRHSEMSQTLAGPFCRDCGLAVFRSSTATTLVAGWWGPRALFATPFALIGNLAARRRAAILGPPQNPTEGRAPLPVGRPVWQRWQIVGILVPFLVAGAVFGIIDAHSNDERRQVNLKIGTCVQTNLTAYGVSGDSRTVSCSAPHDGQIAKRATNQSDCAPQDVYLNIDVGGFYAAYCVAPTGTGFVESH